MSLFIISNNLLKKRKKSLKSLKKEKKKSLKSPKNKTPIRG